MTLADRSSQRSPPPAPDEETLSTREVSKMLSVSEATVKRWTDEGNLGCYRTPGGHRKFRRGDVATFMASHRFASGDTSNLLQVPPLTRDEFLRMALEGDSAALTELLRQELRRGATLPAMLDEIVCPAMQEVGEQWACAGLSVAQEHLVSATVSDVLARLAGLVGVDGGQGSAVVCCLAGERHDMAARMAVVVFRARGWRAYPMGADTPTADLAKFILETRPRVVALSASNRAVAPDEALLSILAVAAKVGATVVGGGVAFEHLRGDVRRATDMRWLDAFLAAAAPPVRA